MKICHFLIGCVFILISEDLKSQSIYFDEAFDASNNLEFGWSVLISSDSNYVTLSNGADFFSGDGTFNLSFFSLAGNIIDNKSYESVFSFPYRWKINRHAELLVEAMLKRGWPIYIIACRHGNSDKSK